MASLEITDQRGDRQEAADRLRAVRPDRGEVPAFIFADPDVYRLELERIFTRCWLFVAHESEIPSPGDYVTRSMGEHPVIVARDEDGAIRVLLNVCRHRGMRICRVDLGNTSHFRCPYHGFTYKNTGELIGVPFERELYGDALVKERLGLIRARVESYAGLVFATWDEQAEPLQQYLGPVTWYLDLLAGRAEMEAVGPPHRYEVATNWKLPAENFAADAYHTMHTHASIAEIGLTPTVTWAKDGYHVCAGNGHGVMIGAPTRRFIFAEDLIPEFERHLSPAQMAVLRQMAHMPGTVFPNFSFLISAVTLNGRFVSHTELMLWQPKGPDRIDACSWFLVEKRAPAWWKELSRQAFVVTFGPSGMLSQDDSENFTQIARNARGPVAGRLALNYEMGLGRTPMRDFPGPGQVYEGKYNEANARAFYARWLELMRDGDPRPDA
ncbi:MAG: aromatic ring-hydroxylating dioxygenase subunit alpha [Armatimonadota bacterium]|nr:aromatic ring-hydroxylating dioxygenase subunit alpha [Armatimonadota bacterium]MDR7549342.1 aromatic ring-hydroxylating dioxygenase subunit alpha [Armatimonadota bacterium]